MKRIAILGTGSYAPDKILTNADLEKMVDTTDEWITQRTGIKERHVSDKDTPTSVLAVKAAERALAAAQVRAEDIDFVICGTVTPDMTFPSMACLVQAKLGAGNSSVAV